MALTNICIHKDWIVYKASDGVIELWKNRGKSGVHRIVTTATDYGEAVEWIDRMSKGKGRKKAEQKRNSKTIDLSEYDNENKTRIE